MPLVRPLLATFLMAGTLLSTATTAWAAPTNDTVDSATVVSSLPFHDSLDTTSATTDATDAAINANCGAPATEASVWYAYTPTADAAILVDVSASNFSAGVIAATGSPGSLNLVACGPQAIAVPTTQGQTVYLMAFDDTAGGANGGALDIKISVAPPPPSLSLTVDPVGSFNARTGVATITGTYSCTGGDYLDLSAQLRQRVGRIFISGYGYTEALCNGTHPFSMQITGDNGKFAGGKTASITFAFSCGVVFCSDYSLEQTVLLKK